jgi:DNA-binding MarR family transcriptional regulator
VTQLVDKLEKRGLVGRERSGEDRRVGRLVETLQAGEAEA